MADLNIREIPSGSPHISILHMTGETGDRFEWRILPAYVEKYPSGNVKRTSSLIILGGQLKVMDPLTGLEWIRGRGYCSDDYHTDVSANVISLRPNGFYEVIDGPLDAYIVIYKKLALWNQLIELEPNEVKKVGNSPYEQFLFLAEGSCKFDGETRNAPKLVSITPTEGETVLGARTQCTILSLWRDPKRLDGLK